MQPAIGFMNVISCLHLSGTGPSTHRGSSTATMTCRDQAGAEVDLPAASTDTAKETDGIASWMNNPGSYLPAL